MIPKNKEWFKEARLGLFMHWGLYSITGRDMWFYSREKTDKDQYERLANRFNPMDFNPEAWARHAKASGMKYAVLIAKHHDGFCLFDSKYTEFKITNTPYGKDIVRMWVEAFRKEGIRIGIYYSLIDWHHPHFTVDYLHPQRDRMDELNRDRDFSKYQEYLHAQICELMSEYGKIDIFWPDFSYATQSTTGRPGKAGEDWKATELIAKIKTLQPDIIMNNRLDVVNSGVPIDMSASAGFRGDFSTPEQYIPHTDMTEGDFGEYMWEACETIGSSWGYYRGDESLKSVQEIIKHIVTCASHNGNLLLNVGPTPRGRIQPEFVDRLDEVGKWLEVNGESIYGAGSSKYRSASGCPELHPIFTQKGRELYMHFLAGGYPSFNIILGGLGGKVDYMEFVSDKTIIEFDEVEYGNFHFDDFYGDPDRNIRIHLPIIKPDPYDTVIRIYLKESALETSGR